VGNRDGGQTTRSGGHQAFSEIRREVTPERRERIDAIKRAMADAVALADVRTGLGITQVELAKRLGVSQGNVSELERRDDVYLSTLREYVEALGGELEISAVFPEQRTAIALGGRKAAAGA
jgi:DNA-binding XRE family transcriptional regulator